MLVLTRTLGEEIVIDGNVRVRVCEVKGGRVKLAIEAPRNVAIRRPEAGLPQEEEVTELRTVWV